MPGGCKEAVTGMLGFYDFFGGVISNLRTFGVRDLVDILVITVAFYELFLFAKKSRAASWFAV